MSDEIERPREWTIYTSDGDKWHVYSGNPMVAARESFKVVEKSYAHTLAAEVSRLKSGAESRCRDIDALDVEIKSLKAKLAACESRFESVRGQAMNLAQQTSDLEAERDELKGYQIGWENQRKYIQAADELIERLCTFIDDSCTLEWEAISPDEVRMATELLAQAKSFREGE